MHASSVTQWALDTATDGKQEVVTFGMRLTNPLNGSWCHWATKARVRREQRRTTQLVCSAPLAEYRTGLAKGYLSRVKITICRIAPRALDCDGLVASAKSVRDGVADALGIKDDSDRRLIWTYDQAKGEPRQYGVRIIVRGWLASFA